MLTDDVTFAAAPAPPAPRTALAGRARPRTYALLAAVLCTVCFATVAPFLRLFEFSNGGENAVVVSVQEVRRGGPWLVPTLHEEQRTKKPPLATWLSALAARPDTVAKLSDADPAVRDAAFRDFAWQVRWPALLAMCGVVAATFALGAVTGGARLGLVSALVCATTFFWMRYARLTTTDAHLALWVSVGNCLFAAAAFDGRRLWLGLAGGGAALGLAMMSKGPVALLQSVVPVLAFVAWRRWWWEPRLARFATAVAEPGAWGDGGDAPRPARRPAGGWLAPLLVGVALFAAIGFSWYLLVWWNNPAVVAEWKRELTRQGATGLEPSKWYNYAGLLHSLFPWCFFFMAGLIEATFQAVRRPQPAPDAGPAGNESGAADAGHIVLPLMLLVVPIVVMSFFPDRELRYLIPLLGPASVLAAWALLELLTTHVRRTGTTAMVALLHWLPLALVTMGLPLAASKLGVLRSMDGGPWYSLRSAVIAAEAFLLMIVAAALLQRRSPVWAVAGGTAVVALVWGAVLNAGYRQDREGRSEIRPLAETILARYPDAQVYSIRPDRPARRAPLDLFIYLNRNVYNLEDVSQLASTSGPRVLLIRQKKDEPPPAVPEGWAAFAAAPYDEATWHAYAPAEQASATAPGG